jgi:Uma2 family endonuclease
MIATGILGEDEHIELISGQILNMSPKGIRHSFVLMQLLRELQELLRRRARIRCQDPISLPNNSEPEPDLVIAKENEYLESHPVPSDIILVVEVADSSVEFDRSTKGDLYASAGIEEYWIVNLQENQLERYWQPRSAIYTRREVFFADQSIAIPQFSEAVLNLAVIFPP